MKRLVLLVCSIIAPIAICATRAQPIAYFGIEFRWGDAASDRFLHVARVTPNGPAAKAGILPGDLITHVAGSASTSAMSSTSYSS
jgi:S1-C subfamily serine protease